MTSYYTRDELNNLGFKNLGEEVYISKKASLYGIENISVGSFVRIDDFAILSGRISIGSFVHIAAGTMIFGGKTGVEMKDFSTVSSRCAIYSETDDYEGIGLSLPLLDDDLRVVYKGKVIINKHVLIGSGSTVLPGVELGEGASVGAMSLVKNSLEPWKMYVGIPVRVLKDRKKTLLELEEKARARCKKISCN